MPNKRNKNKENAFYYYMVERKPEVERKYGRRIQMAELPSYVHGEWKALPESSKQRYKEMCINYKESQDKYDSRGISLSSLQEAENEKKNKRFTMEEDIKQLVKMLYEDKTLVNEMFYVLNMSYYIEAADQTFVPAEAGVIQFSIKNGVNDIYHRIFEEKIPLGYRKEAMDHSAATHQLLGMAEDDDVRGASSRRPLTSFEEEILAFLSKEGGKIPMLFVQEDFIHSIETMISQFALDRICHVYSLDVLMQQIYTCVIKDIPLCIATDFLNAGTFDYINTLSCKWHQIVIPDASMYCTLNICHRLIFNFLHALEISDNFGIVPIKDKHFKEIPMPEMSRSEIEVNSGQANSGRDWFTQSRGSHQMRGVAGASSNKSTYGFGRGSRNRKFDS